MSLERLWAGWRMPYVSAAAGSGGDEPAETDSRAEQRQPGAGTGQPPVGTGQLPSGTGEPGAGTGQPRRRRVTSETELDDVTRQIRGERPLEFFLRKRTGVTQKTGTEPAIRHDRPAARASVKRHQTARVALLQLMQSIRWSRARRA